MIYNVVTVMIDAYGFQVITEIITAYRSKLAAEKRAAELVAIHGPFIKVIDTELN